jgi:hypothetical protein
LLITANFIGTFANNGQPGANDYRTGPFTNPRRRTADMIRYRSGAEPADKEVEMSAWKRRSATMAIAVLSLAGVPEMIAIVEPSGVARADVCVNAGRRISVSGCTNVADAVAPYAPPPMGYAPMPEDYPPPPAPNVQVCANFGRRISVSGCA